MDTDWMDVEAVLVRRLRDALRPLMDPDGSRKLGVATDTPADLKGRWFVRVQVVTGSDDGLTDSPMVDVETFAPTREDSSDLAMTTRRVLLAMAGTDTSPDGRQLFDTVRTATRPVWVDYRNPDVQRFVATYWVTSRLQ